VRQYVLTRSAYGPGWSIEANRRRLAMTRAITIRSLASQTSRHFRWLVLLHRSDPLLAERMAAFGAIGADFLYLDTSGTSVEVAWQGYLADWRAAIGPRDDLVAMTRLDDDDGLAPWVMERIGEMAGRVKQRTALMLPLGVRVWNGGYTLVRHMTNAMHTLVTPPDDEATVYDYGHRKVRQFAHVQHIDNRVAWLWTRHEDTISGWRTADRPLTAKIRSLFDVDWSALDRPFVRQRATQRGMVFR
jgi:putative rhamnosyltransferase